ncbi:aldehyde dehydrogenase family protein [Pseudomonas gingeri]|uniref:aldehyde dehydrogenase family protein n=1 Tax=Pseudomonas gingeri TaxID=117681 RepID=UPI0015A4482E|nr:aldehyde dehydrogenase family protein [Pseudomonas gingeri]NVZ60493.1 aldehyde dehydrogenase family protein [Pseudomonas gingeri]NVZ78362.1 aldehyde dehydrogenase family protein [Pseudomonas gingeri]
MSDFKLTYSTMFNPPAELHEQFERAMATLKHDLGRDYGLFIDGRNVVSPHKIEKRSPIDQYWLLGRFHMAREEDVEAAMQAAHKAFPAWRSMPWQGRIELLRKVARLIEERVYRIAAAVSLETGKNRMEALGEVQETAVFFDHYCDLMEQHQGFDQTLPNDPLEDFISTNRSVLKPYGAWVVIAPYNFPFALAGGPTAAALVTGNTVVLKGASETPWSGRLLAECVRDAGIPDGVFNYLNGSGSVIGQALVDHPQAAGITFTGSYEVGMRIARAQLDKAYPRPCIAEMGGKNAVIVSRHADLERAALGIIRSAFGMQGQKCSALSRLYVEEPVAESLIALLTQKIQAISIGDPAVAGNWMGPVATRKAYDDFAAYSEQLQQHGARLISGGEQLRSESYVAGFYCTPTLVEAPLEHPLWTVEMFLPIVMLARVKNLDQAMQLTNASQYGLTAGFYGNDQETNWFFEHVDAGVTYANRPQGATTGAWPGYQPFGGWKGSGNTGKAIASFYYLPQYLREQSQTRVE